MPFSSSFTLNQGFLSSFKKFGIAPYLPTCARVCMWRAFVPTYPRPRRGPLMGDTLHSPHVVLGCSWDLAGLATSFGRYMRGNAEMMGWLKLLTWNQHGRRNTSSECVLGSWAGAGEEPADTATSQFSQTLKLGQWAHT